MKNSISRDGRPVQIIIEEFPEELQGRVRGLTIMGDENYTIMIDSSRHPLIQRRTLGHELAHIYMGHLDQSEHGWRPMDNEYEYSVDKSLEHEANLHAWEYYRLYRDGNLPG